MYHCPKGTGYASPHPRPWRAQICFLRLWVCLFQNVMQVEVTAFAVWSLSLSIKPLSPGPLVRVPVVGSSHCRMVLSTAWMRSCTNTRQFAFPSTRQWTLELFPIVLRGVIGSQVLVDVCSFLFPLDGGVAGFTPSEYL